MLSLKWFKSAIERTIEKAVENKIEQAFSELDKEEGAQAPSFNPGFNWSSTSSTWSPQTGPTSYTKPYLNIKMVNDTLTVVMNDGNIITKAPATADDFNAARECKTEACLFDLVSTQEARDQRRKAEAEYEKAKAVKKGAEFLAKFDDFEMKHGSLYLKGINRSIPPLMVEEFLEIIGSYSFNGMANIDEMNLLVQEDEEYQALKRFFMWCCLNPRAEVADKLYNFLRKNSFKITKQGFFVALRNVVTLHGSNELVHFVSNAYNKVKAVWKKKPDDYLVFFKDGEYKMVAKSVFEELEPCTFCDGTGYVPYHEEDDCFEGYNDCYNGDNVECPECSGSGTVYKNCESQYGEEIGNLTELYLDLPNRAENRFTDAHTRTFDIRIGRPVSMPMENCRWNTDDCGAEGLHFTSDEIHYVGCGDTSVIVLINPMKVVGIGESKGRCYEYLPIMTVPREEATEILHDLDFDTLQLDDSYAVRELQNLAEKAKEGFTAEAKKYDFNLPALSAVEVYTIVKSLDEIKEEISGRIVTID
jgi:hypothetical protein